MDYNYNYGYLQQYMDSHHLVKKDLLEALGCKDYVSLNKWLEGKVPVHITAMLRFCNYYNVPLANFFTDKDGMPCDFAPLMPDEHAQLAPTDGYGIREGVGRGIVETHVSERHPSSTNAASAVAEGLKRKAEQRNMQANALRQMAERNNVTETDANNDAGKAAETANLSNSQTVETILRLQLEQSKELRKAEQEHRDKEDTIRARYDDERTRLLNIIEQQAKEIARLSAGTRLKAYGNIQGDNGFIGVAEGDPKDGREG